MHRPPHGASHCLPRGTAVLHFFWFLCCTQKMWTNLDVWKWEPLRFCWFDSSHGHFLVDLSVFKGLDLYHTVWTSATSTQERIHFGQTLGPVHLPLLRVSVSGRTGPGDDFFGPGSLRSSGERCFSPRVRVHPFWFTKKGCQLLTLELGRKKSEMGYRNSNGSWVPRLDVTTLLFWPVVHHLKSAEPKWGSLPKPTSSTTEVQPDLLPVRYHQQICQLKSFFFPNELCTVYQYIFISLLRKTMLSQHVHPEVPSGKGHGFVARQTDSGWVGVLWRQPGPCRIFEAADGRLSQAKA